MTHRLRILYLCFKGSLPLALLPIILMNIGLPAMIVSTFELPPESARLLFVFTSQMLASISCIACVVSYFQICVDSEGEEMLRMSIAHRKFHPFNILMIWVALMLISLPVYLWAQSRDISSIWEFIRIGSINFFLLALFYLVVTMTHSVSLSTGVLVSYLFAGYIYSITNDGQILLVIKPHVLSDLYLVRSYYLPVFIVSTLLILLANILERKLYRSV